MHFKSDLASWIAGMAGALTVHAFASDIGIVLGSVVTGMSIYKVYLDIKVRRLELEKIKKEKEK